MRSISKFFYLSLLFTINVFKGILIILFLCLICFLLFGIFIGILQLWESHAHFPMGQRLAIILLPFMPVLIISFTMLHGDMTDWIKNKLN